MTRRRWDQYFTPAHATRELMKHVNFTNCYVLECCNGDGAITSVVREVASVVKTNDIDQDLLTDYHRDVSIAERWKTFPQGGHWVVSNPPFNQAPQIIPLAYEYANVGIAMLLRLSYLEPCFTRKSNRAAWLAEHPPTQLIVLPRISFTGDGKTDNVTCAWMVWDKRVSTSSITIVPRATNRETEAADL